MRRTADTYELSSMHGVCQVCEVVKEFSSNGLTYEVGDTVAVVYSKFSRTMHVCLFDKINNAIDNYDCIIGLEVKIKYSDISSELKHIETLSQFNEYFKPIPELTEYIQQYDAYIKSVYEEKCAAIENENNNRGWLRNKVNENLDMILIACMLSLCATCMSILFTSMKETILCGVITLLNAILIAVHAYDSLRYNKIYNKYNKPIVLPYSKWKNANSL